MSSPEQLVLLKTNAVISVVDDDDSMRISLQRLLISMGFAVETFPSAREFLKQGHLHAHGCVIVDVRMPEMNGLDLQQSLSDAGIPLPVVFMTAYEDPGVRARAMQGGALAFLQKPFSDTALMDVIWLSLKRSRQLLVSLSRSGALP